VLDWAWDRSYICNAASCSYLCGSLSIRAASCRGFPLNAANAAGKGPVAAHRHPNGSVWVADTATVDGYYRLFGQND